MTAATGCVHEVVRWNFFPWSAGQLLDVNLCCQEREWACIKLAELVWMALLYRVWVSQSSLGSAVLSATEKSGWSHSWAMSVMFQVLLGLVQWCRCLRFVAGSCSWCAFYDGVQEMCGSCQRRAPTTWTRLICLVNLQSGVWKLYLRA